MRMWFKFVVSMFIVVPVTFLALLLMTGAVSLVRLETPIATFKEIDQEVGLGLYITDMINWVKDKWR